MSDDVAAIARHFVEARQPARVMPYFAARLFAETGRQQQADVQRAEAGRVVDEIAALFQDDRLRSAFVAGAQTALAGIPN